MSVQKTAAAEAELSILGGVMLDNGAIDRIAGLEPAHFAAESHQIIFAVMQRLAAADEPIDAVTLATAMNKASILDAAGGINYLMRLSDAAASAINIGHHAKLVRDYATVRQFMAELDRLHLAAATDDYDTVEALIGAASDSMMALSQGRGGSSMVTMGAALTEAIGQVKKAYENKGQVNGLATGFDDIDALTHGLEPGQLIILAARPAMGKSALVFNIATNVAKQGKSVAFFSLEMGAAEIAKRLLAAEGRVDSDRLKTGLLEDGDIDRLLQVVKVNARLPIHIDDASGIGVPHVRSECRRIAADMSTDPLGLVVIDYLQLMKGDRRGNREQEISGIARDLKALARALGVPVIALSQLSRNCEGRADKRPMLSDLRESGAIEQDADIVAFVYRDEYYDEDTVDKGVAEVILGKNRSGPTGKARLRFLGAITRFMNIFKGE